MIGKLEQVRLSRMSLAVLACVSGLATVVIVATGVASTPAQLAALAALSEPAAHASAGGSATGSTGAGGSAAGGGSQGSGGTGSGARSGSGGGPGSGGSGSGSGGSSSGSGGADTGGSGSGSGGSGGSGSGGSGSGGSGSGGSGGSGSSSQLPKVRHVFEIALSTPSYDAVFGRRSAAPYLRSLVAKATLLSGYESLGSGELADYLATVGGQKPNPDTSAGCPTYAEFPSGAVANKHGLVPGTGCLYPETALSIGDQVTASGHVWKAYISDMGTQTCVHPNSNAVDDAALPGTGPNYDTRHNPFIYFHSLVDLGDCASDDVDLSKLSAALAKTSRTAMFSYVAPNACADADATTTAGSGTVSGTTTASTSSTTSAGTTTGTTTAGTATTTTSTTTGATTGTTTGTTTTGSTTTGTTTTGTTPTSCAPGQPVAIAAEDAFLKTWVPKILGSPAYKKDGVLVIDFAGTQRTGHAAATGALVLSRYATKGRKVTTRLTPYSLLASVEQMLSFTRLARASGATSFAKQVLNQSS